VNKNCLNDVRVGCMALSSLVELVASKVDLEEELNELECSFEWDALKKNSI
jgi:hypothetical protein